MPTYTVTVDRTERIEFTLEAPDGDDAIERYMVDGDETGSTTLAIQLVRVTEVKS